MCVAGDGTVSSNQLDATRLDSTRLELRRRASWHDPSLFIMNTKDGLDGAVVVGGGCWRWLVVGISLAPMIVFKRVERKERVLFFTDSLHSTFYIYAWSIMINCE
jgi:hypothetical protein